MQFQINSKVLMKGAAIEHIAAARFHSVVATDTHVYTFGLNAGQLGHAKSEKHCSVCHYLFNGSVLCVKHHSYLN